MTDIVVREYDPCNPDHKLGNPPVGPFLIKILEKAGTEYKSIWQRIAERVTHPLGVEIIIQHKAVAIRLQPFIFVLKTAKLHKVLLYLLILLLLVRGEMEM